MQRKRLKSYIELDEFCGDEIFCSGAVLARRREYQRADSTSVIIISVEH